MKKILYVLLTVIMLTLGKIDISAEDLEGAGGNYGNGSVTGCGDVDSCWEVFGESQVDGFRLSLYKLETSGVVKVGESKDFINDKKAIELIKNNNGITYISSQAGKIDYKKGTTFSSTTTTDKSKFSGNLYYLKFYDFFGEEGVDYNGSYHIINGAFGEDNEITKFYTEDINDDVKKYYLVLEPLTIVTYNYKQNPKVYFYGTSYEHAEFLDGGKYTYSYAGLVPQSHLPLGAIIDKIDNSDTANFNGFLSAAGFKDKLATIGCDDKDKGANTGACYYKFSNIKEKTYGMQVFWMGDLAKKLGKEETCTTAIDHNICGNTFIQEPTTKACVLGHENYYLASYNDTSKIYCSNDISTNFSSFYNTFSSTIRSGSYFSMKNLSINNTKTCYIKYDGSISNASGWQNTVYEDLKGPINLTLGNRTYKLEETISKGTPVCKSWQSGVCTKATLTTTFTYALNPFVNRFISIHTTKEDSVQEQTETNKDLGGPHLTIPLNYPNGQYNYYLDLRGSILNSFVTNIPKGEHNTNIEGISYKLTYDVEEDNDKLTSDNLYAECKYNAIQNPCEDEDGNPIPCSPTEDSCSTDEKGKCCIGGKVTDCPPVCDSDCCDSNGKPIPCPLPPVVYRPISLIEPFPGIKGIGRTPGSNWNKFITINGKKQSYSDYYIRYNRGYDDYDVYQTEPLYVIKLDYNALKSIRKYNDAQKHNYNNFDLRCLDGEQCISKFLRGQADGFSLNLISSGTCKDINHASFDSCISRKRA